MEILPSIAAADQSCLKEEIIKLGEDIVRSLHIDIEDGNFVPNITFGLKTLKDLRKLTKMPFSVHLLVTNPEVYVEELSELGTDEIAVHIEACSYPRKVINLIRNKGVKVGLAINPKTPINTLKCYVGEIDSILIMTSEPDGKDQNFIYQCLEKVKELNNIKSRNFKIEVDGGIKEEHLKSIWEAGADIIVMGRAIFNSRNSREQLIKLKKLILKLEQNGR
jgi:ribulose-phosphate 3-epimerase